MRRKKRTVLWALGRRIEAYTTVKDMSISAIDAIEANYKPPKAKKSQKRASLLEMDDFDPLGFDSFPKKSKASKANKANKANKAEKKNETSSSEEFRTKLSVLTGDASIQDDGIVSGTWFLSFSPLKPTRHFPVSSWARSAL